MKHLILLLLLIIIVNMLNVGAGNLMVNNQSISKYEAVRSPQLLPVSPKIPQYSLIGVTITL